MATGGWGGYASNPFGQQPPAPGGTESPERDPRPGGGAYGAWGSPATSAGAWAPQGSPSPAKGKPPAASAAAAAAPSAPPATFNIDLGGGSLEQRAAALARREAELAKRESDLAHLNATARPNNFPPLWPVTYHNISEQIPPYNRSMIRFHFMTELLVVAGLIWNAAIMLAAMFCGKLSLTWWLVSFIALILGVPLSWGMYYKSLCRAANTDGALYPYLRSALTILINVAWCVWMVLGLNKLGEFSGGIFPLLRFFQAKGDAQSLAFGILCIINVVIWGLAGVGSWLSLGLAVAAMRRGAAPRLEYESRLGMGPSGLPTV
ncbi:hypothetical protein Rsub_03011 [Raphidocelis subcapitata]|uniref:Secretory carrier-associated membrane protein n=1 Tax=Raphidocelis subcapitata TaxID=307507 RepID=A0A2V0NYP3_9CHLO|nr:hypothetical protein Rsub_03011 [Raphidocelis subcapitata]|eukprot:GBF90710.1 hypothetical protein Rsub_03011 [Raphidocelis subcapitata]